MGTATRPRGTTRPRLSRNRSAALCRRTALPGQAEPSAITQPTLPCGSLTWLLHVSVEVTCCLLFDFRSPTTRRTQQRTRPSTESGPATSLRPPVRGDQVGARASTRADAAGFTRLDGAALPYTWPISLCWVIGSSLPGNLLERSAHPSRRQQVRVGDQKAPADSHRT